MLRYVRQACVWEPLSNFYGVHDEIVGISRCQFLIGTEATGLLSGCRWLRHTQVSSVVFFFPLPL